MEYNSKTWPYKWFGIWKEYGEDFADYPSIISFINNIEKKDYKKELLLNYLDNGIEIFATGRINFPSPFTGKIEYGSIVFKTDGEWVWLENISDFVRDNSLALPEKFYQHIENNKFVIPKVNEEILRKISFPSLHESE